MNAPKKIVFASDWAPIRAFSPLLEADPEAVYGDLLPILRSADCNIVNLEAPLSSQGDFIVKSGAAFSGEEKHVSALKVANFKAAVCANNHAFDRGNEGFFRTREVLKSNGIACVGAGENLSEARKPFVFTLGGAKTALYAISEGEDMRGAKKDAPGVRPWEPEELARELRRAGKKYDIIIVSAHCGLEYQPYPSYYVYEAFKLWAKAGASIIVGHHPHVPQGMACFGGVPAYFSLGNFVFHQPVKQLYRKIGYLLEIEIDASGIKSHRPIPYRITDRGVRRLGEDGSADFSHLMKELSAPLESPDTAREAWHAVLAANGVSGFRRELEKILSVFREDPPAGAAMMRNRICCMQHFSQWSEGFDRIVSGTIGDAPKKYVETVEKYLTREVQI